MIIGEALENYWKLAAIDSIELLPDIGLNKVIDVLIENPKIKESLLRDAHLTVTDNVDQLVRTSNNNSNGRGGVGVQKYAFS